MTILKDIIINQIRKSIVSKLKISQDKLLFCKLDIDFINKESFLKDKQDKVLVHSNIDILGEYSDILLSRLKNKVEFDKLEYLSMSIDFENKKEVTTMYYILNNKKIKTQTNFI